MQQSENINELATALCEAQAEMRGAVKDSRNPFFKSKYADLVSVMKAIKDSFQRHGLSFTQFPHIEHKKGYVFVKDQAKEVDMLHVGVTTTLMHTSGQYQQHSFALPLSKQDPQAAGAAITYAKRYALQGVAGIPSEDDDAESAMNRQPQYKAQPKSNAQAAVDYAERIKNAKSREALDIVVAGMKEKKISIKSNERYTRAYQEKTREFKTKH